MTKFSLGERHTGLLALAFLILSSPQVFASPSKAIWSREIPIGHDADSYLTLRIERLFPGSYYNLTDAMYFRSYALDDGRLLREVLVQKTRYLQPNAEPPWVSEEEPVNIAEGMQKLGTWPNVLILQSPWLEKYELAVKTEGIFVGQENERKLLIDAETLRQYLRPRTYGMSALGSELTNVVGVFVGSTNPLDRKPHLYFFLVVQYGIESDTEHDFFQSVVPIPAKTVNEAIASFGKANGSKNAEK